MPGCSGQPYGQSSSWRGVTGSVTNQGQPYHRRPWDLSEPGDREWFEPLGDGLVVVWPPPSAGGWAMSGGAWLHLAPSGLVTAFSGKVDVGQDNRTAFRLLVAEELDVPVGHVHIVAGDTDVPGLASCWPTSLPGARSGPVARPARVAGPKLGQETARATGGSCMACAG